MADLRWVLASASPRRAELLGRLGLEVEVRPADVDEALRRGEEVDAYVQRLALAKAGAVAAFEPAAVVVGADTAVVAAGDILGKPRDGTEAEAFLRRLSGRSHDVLTGVVVMRGERVASALARTTVTFAAVSEQDIAAYVATGSPLDKAGAYGIQDMAAAFVERIEGSDTNVVGLPLAVFVRLCRTLGADPLPSPGR